MKRTKFIIGFLLVVLSSSGAIFTKVNTAPNTYWYKNWIFFCNPIVVDFDCEIDPVGGCLGPPFSEAEDKQLYLTDDCEIPLKRV